MIIQTYSMGTLLAKIKIEGKRVTYCDTQFIVNDTIIENILKDGDLKSWEKRLGEVGSEEEIAKEIEIDMRAQGFVLAEEAKR